MRKEVEDEKKKLKKNEILEWEETNWIKKAEVNNGNALLPKEWVMSMLINACKQTRMIPHYATKKNETYTRYVQSCIIQDTSPLGKSKELKEYGKYLPSQGAKGGGKVWRVRPMLDKWDTTFTFVDPFGRMKRDELKELLEYGGMFIGIGDSRNQGFGRFIVDSVKEVK
jgi:hypothetical protein